MNNIKIAKELIKLASLLASSEEENEGLCFEDIVNSKEFPGFTKKVENDNEIEFTYNADETESCYIVFQNEGNKYGYTVMVNNDETKSVSKPTCEQAFKDLSNHIQTYVRSFDVFLSKMEQEMIK